MYIVTSGLQAGEVVISEGLSRVHAGQQVQAQIQPFAVEEKMPKTAPLSDETKMDQLETAIEDSEAPDAQALPQVETSLSTQPATASTSTVVQPAATK